MPPLPVVEDLKVYAAQRLMSALSVRPSRDSRSSGGALTTIALSATIAAVRPLRAVSLAILTWRIISAVPSADLGTAVAAPESTERAAA